MLQLIPGTKSSYSKDIAIAPIPHGVARQLVIRHHYLSSMPGGTSLCFGVFHDGSLRGAITLGTGPPNAFRLVEGATNGDCLVLTRFWLSDDLPHNSASKVIGMLVRSLKLHTVVKFLITYADPSQGHVGTIYQATNWIYTGLSDPTPYYRLDGGSPVHSRSFSQMLGTRSRVYLGERGINVTRVAQIPKYRYFYFLDKRWKQRLILGCLPYPNSNHFRRGPGLDERIFCSCALGRQAEAGYELGLERRRLQREQQEQMLEESHRNEILAKSGIPKRFYQVLLAESPFLLMYPELLNALIYRDRPESEQEVESACYIDWRERYNESWFFWGPAGTGKTSIACALARDRILKDWDSGGGIPKVLFRSVPNMLSQLRSTYGRNEGISEWELIEEQTKAHSLVLDDLGAENVRNTEWRQDRLYQVIGERHAQGTHGQTIITSNKSIEELSDQIGDRVAYRIVEMCNRGRNIVHVDCENLRFRD